MTEWILFMTPKAYAHNFKEEIIKDDFRPFKIEVTSMIYMNMMDGWTEDECDNIVYIVDKKTFINQPTFKLDK